MRLVAVLIVLLAACAHSPRGEASSTQRFAGYYEAEWERQVFHPCNSPELWWAWNTAPIVQESEGRFGRYFVVLEGEVSPVGRYGHLGRYPRQILVTKVLEVRPEEGGGCGSVL